MKITIAGSVIPFTGLKRQYENLRGEILDTTDRVFSSGQLMSGPHTQAFEKWLADKNHVRYAVTCHSGTNALEIIANYYASRTRRHQPRSSVLMPTMTYAATANAFIQAGWDIQFADTDPYGVIDFKKLHDAEYEAVVLIGLYGAKTSYDLLDQPPLGSIVKSQYLDICQERRKTIAEYYMSRFQSANIRCLIDDTNWEGHSFHKFVIDIDNRDAVQKQLLDCGIETKIHYTHPLHEVGMFSRYTGPDILSCASSLARRVISLPIYPELTDAEIEYIANQVIDCVSEKHS